MVGADPLRRLRILHLILVVGETNGQYNEHCLPLARERDLSICTYFTPQLTPPAEIRLFSGDGSLKGFFRALRAALDAQEYDVVHCHAPQTGLLLLMAMLAWRRLRPLRSSLVYTVQDSFYDYKLRNQVMMIASLGVFRRVIFCSWAAYESLPLMFKRLVRNRWRVVQNGVDIERVDRALDGEKRIRDDARFTVLSVGRLDKVKDPAVLLDAFEASAGPDDRLIFVGAGLIEHELVARTARPGLSSRVLFTGLIARDQVFVQCARADVFVSASRGEGLPVSVMEAMVSGCPVILSDIPPHRELADGAGFIPLIAPGDVDGFAREIRRYRHMTSAERIEMGRRSREHIVARFSLPIMHAGTETVYREVVKPADTNLPLS